MAEDRPVSCAELGKGQESGWTYVFSVEIRVVAASTYGEAYLRGCFEVRVYSSSILNSSSSNLSLFSSHQYRASS